MPWLQCGILMGSLTGIGGGSKQGNCAASENCKQKPGGGAGSQGSEDIYILFDITDLIVIQTGHMSGDRWLRGAIVITLPK